MNMAIIASRPLKTNVFYETIISIQLTNSNEHAYDSFITLKKQMYS